MFYTVTNDVPVTQVIDTKADCLGRNLTWKNSPIHFDHVGHAYLALFQVVKYWLAILLWMLPPDNQSIQHGVIARCHY